MSILVVKVKGQVCVADERCRQEWLCLMRWSGQTVVERLASGVYPSSANCLFGCVLGISAREMDDSPLKK